MNPMLEDRISIDGDRRTLLERIQRHLLQENSQGEKERINSGIPWRAAEKCILNKFLRTSNMDLTTHE
jgi:hypothetical protein